GLAAVASIIQAAALFAALYATNTRLPVALLASALIVIGCFYYQWDDHRYQTAIDSLPAAGILHGMISAVPKVGADFQSFSLKTDSGTISVTTHPDPQYSYGDVLTVKGKIEPPTSNYFSRHVIGLMRDPSIVKNGNDG